MSTPTVPPNRPPRSVFLPYPELVLPGPPRGRWTIEDANETPWLPTNGAANKIARQLWVPLEPGAEGVALHELGHVRFSPDRLPRVRFPLILLQAVEDARINLALAALGLPVELDREQLARVAHLTARDAKSGDVAATIVRGVASLGTGASETVRRELEALAPRSAALALGWVDRVEHRLERARVRRGEAVAPFRVAHHLAKRLARDLDRQGLVTPGFAVRGLGCCEIEGEGEPTRRRGRFDAAAYDRAIERRRGRGATALASGHMKIARPPLTVRQPSVLRAGMAARRVALEGTRIARPDRYALDRAIFHRTGRGGGGTILIDQSGSMSLSIAELEDVVRAAGGAAVVAVYSGRGDVGELRIVARGDRRVAPEHLRPFASGNVVDLPALEWLARQPEPRLHVSDGCVSGVGDEGCSALRRACQAVSETARITRVDNAREAVEWLAARAR